MNFGGGGARERGEQGSNPGSQATKPAALTSSPSGPGKVTIFDSKIQDSGGSRSRVESMLHHALYDDYTIRCMMITPYAA